MLNKIVKKTFVILIVFLFQHLQALDSKQIITQVDEEIQELVGQMIGLDGLTFSNPIEKHIIHESLYSILNYVKQSYPEEKWRKCAEHLQHGKTISEALIAVYERTPSQLIIELIQALKDDLPDASQGTRLLKRINEFKIFYYDKEKPNDDYPYIEYLIKTYSEGIGKFFWDDEQKRIRYQKNLKNIKDGGIEINLITDVGMLDKVFRTKWQTAVTDMNLNKVGDQLYIGIKILFPYPHLLVTLTFTHELAHVIQFLSMVEEELTMPFSMSQMKSDLIKIRIKMLTKTMINIGGGPLNEGMAEFLSQQHNLMYKYKIFDDIDDQLRQYFQKAGFAFNLENLQKNIINQDINKRILAYHVAHSLFRYTLRRFGKDKAFRLMISPESDDDYKEILGMDLKTLNKDWVKYLDLAEEIFIPYSNK